ncbi:MAG: PIN domain-containing protein [Synergistaceae bacterium]|jgi:predicted nucleic acid-binding protein|nr:PIN domain-containing protein [Synergistaceae bacterium]
MRLLLDTNNIVDVLSKRDGFMDSLKILRCCEAKRAEGYVSAITVTDVMYILRKNTAAANVRDALLALISIVDVADVTSADIKGAFSCGMRDFEDAAQSMCAERIVADFIVTRNVKDFVLSPVQAVTPSNALALISG